MSVNRRRRDNAIEIQENSAVFDIVGGTLRPDPETVENHIRQIEYLQKEIEERDKTLSRLKQEFNDLLAQNDDLQITLESKSHEVEALKDKVSKLETEKKIFETKLQNVELEFKDSKDQNDEKSKEIHDLKISLESKDKELTDLKREVNDLKDQNDEKNNEIKYLKDQNDERAKEIKDLTISLKSKDKEIIALRREVQNLTDQNEELKVSLKASGKERNELKDTIRELQNKLKSLELSTEDLNKRSEDAEEERKKIKEHNNKLKLAIEKQSKKIERMTKERAQKEKEDYEWRKQWQPNMQLLESHRRRGGLPLADPVEKAYIVLGQMCSQVQTMMYQKVLPDMFNKEYTRYKVKSIEEGIGKKKGDVQRQAIERWDNLKKELSWDEINHPCTLKEIQSERNIVAHPGVLTKESLLQSENVMQEAREKCGRMRLTHVREIIEMWDHLTQMK